MFRLRFLRSLRPAVVSAALLILGAGACSLPQFDFPDTPRGGTAGETSSGGGASGGSGGSGAVGADGGAGSIPHCENGELDSDQGESDFDCGRGCSPCRAGSSCIDVADCEEGLLCNDGTCIEAGCINGVQDGNETDKDCGGGGCVPCTTGQGCHRSSDCDSQVCSGVECVAPACDDRVENGKETALDCGGGCPPCAADQPCEVGDDCTSGQCFSGSCGSDCTEGLANCDEDNANGCEINVRTDVVNCGSCGHICKLPHATAECTAGECHVTTDGCDAGYADCNGKPEDGCEVNLKTNKLNCGTCDKVCPNLNGDPSCVAGTCQITCNDGYADCDDSRDNGCEINLKTSVKNCNQCDQECTADAGNSAYCKNGACGQTTCPAGSGDCNGDPADACETALTSDVDNCGACGNKCVAVNANVACVNSKCVITDCKAPYADCTGGFGDGCETNTDTSTTHCGGCNKGCTISNGTPKCDLGSCEVKTCSGTFRDCDGDPKTGCEVNLATSTANCGTCGTNCNAIYPHATATCALSVCSGPICNNGYGDCNSVPGDGCESNVLADPDNCGGCGKACSTSGSAHVTSNACSAGQCDPQCAGSYLTCDNNKQNGCESDSNTDAANCGACGSVCSTAAAAHVTNNSCSAGDCNPQCAGTYADCDGNGNNGCEVDTSSTRTSCGGCGAPFVCDTSAAAHVSSNDCSGSKCQPVCSGTYKDCDTSRFNGCEKDVSADKNNCGGCGTVCGTQNATATSCSSGSCNPSCSPGWGKCTTPNLGCVTPLGTSTDCLTCGDACTSPNVFCDSGSGCVDHRDIVVVNSGAGAATANSAQHAIAGWTGVSGQTAKLTVNHGLQTAKGNNRMVLVGVIATPNFTNPENISVTYGGTNMLLAKEQRDSGLQAYAGIYYLLDAALPDTTGSKAVVATFSASTSPWGHGGLDVIELKNVMQVAPIATNGAGGGNCGSAPTISSTVTFTQPGSLVYGVLGGVTANSVTLTGTGTPTPVETWNQLQSTPDKGHGAAAYALGDSSRTLTWNVPTCNATATAIVAIKRLNWN
jgi:hypothetical protein